MNKEVHDKFTSLVRDLMQGRIHNLDSNLIHAVLGIGTEAGEIQDLVKKNMFYNKSLDILTLKEECSDLLHYIQMLVGAVDSSLEEIMAINIAKLTTRYPEGYTRDKALIRDKVAERKAMEEVEKEYHG
jgi:NTP pyrophosphatase (non-canonical NTP hydrolase)